MVLSLFDVLALAAATLAGFGVGRIKNAAKLAALKAEVLAVVKSGETKVENLVAAIEAKFKAL